MNVIIYMINKNTMLVFMFKWSTSIVTDVCRSWWFSVVFSLTSSIKNKIKIKMYHRKTRSSSRVFVTKLLPGVQLSLVKCPSGVRKQWVKRDRSLDCGFQYISSLTLLAANSLHTLALSLWGSVTMEQNHPQVPLRPNQSCASLINHKRTLIFH